MQLYVNPSDEVPIFRQLVRQFTEAIASGRLAPGEKLSSQRELSEQLVIAPMTVKRVYDELEQLGFVATERGRGTFVRHVLPQADRADRNGRLAATARSLLSQAYLGGLKFADVLNLLKETDREMTEGRPPKENP
jgi:GntR family transcriptional regulator